MTLFKLKFIHRFRDRHGKVRHYFRRPGYRTVPLPGLPGSDAFMEAYRAALATERPAGDIGAARTIPGTVSAAVVAYFNSAGFQSLAPSTKATYRGILEGFRERAGDLRLATLERRHIENMIANRASTPAAANNLLRMLRVLMQFAVSIGLRRDDPTAGVKGIKTRSDGFYTWAEQDIEAFERKHPVGTRARLALALLLYTAQRRGDVVTIGRQHIRDGVLTLRQQKTGTLVEIPLHPELRNIIAATPSDHLTFLTTESGKPFSPAGFGNLFREWCRAAGLPDACSAHGLRKAASRRLAEAGATAHEIMAITGHKTLKEVTRYTSAVDRKKLGVSAMKKITPRTEIRKPR